MRRTTTCVCIGRKERKRSCLQFLGRFVGGILLGCLLGSGSFLFLLGFALLFFLCLSFLLGSGTGFLDLVLMFGTDALQIGWVSEPEFFRGDPNRHPSEGPTGGTTGNGHTIFHVTAQIPWIGCLRYAIVETVPLSDSRAFRSGNQDLLDGVGISVSHDGPIGRTVHTGVHDLSRVRLGRVADTDVAGTTLGRKSSRDGRCRIVHEEHTNGFLSWNAIGLVECNVLTGMRNGLLCHGIVQRCEGIVAVLRITRESRGGFREGILLHDDGSGTIGDGHFGIAIRIDGSTPNSNDIPRSGQFRTKDFHFHGRGEFSIGRLLQLFGLGFLDHGHDALLGQCPQLRLGREDGRCHFPLFEPQFGVDAHLVGRTGRPRGVIEIDGRFDGGL
mmetsp:Transcript_18539/g.42924  ORF Transcript_18539/g.42924 Transcript_18539/m.42924 type:complete len:386 (-) Transcript_18539:90-1247(-)